MHQVHIALGNGHAQARALVLRPRAVFLLGKLVEDVFDKVLAHAHAGVGHPVAHADVPLVLAGMVVDLKGNAAAVLREFHRIAQNVHQHLADAHGVGQHIGRCRRLQDGVKVDVPVGQESVHDAQHRVRHFRDVHRHGGKLDFPALNAADVQHIVDECQQVVGALLDLLQAAPYLRLGLLLHGDVGKADDGVHGRADVMGHVVQENGLGAVGIFRRMHRVLQLLVDFLVAGAVGHIQDVLFLPLNVAAEGNHVEPAHLARDLMGVFAVKLQLLAGEDVGQSIQHQGPVVAADEMLDDVHLLAHLRLGDAQQLFNIGAGVIHPQIPGVQHQEHIVHVGGQLGEQFVPGQQFLVLLLQLQAVLLDNQQNQHHGQGDGNGGYHQHGGGLQPVHAGVDHLGGHHAQHHPVLEIGGFIHQVIGLAIKIKHRRAGVACPEVLLQGKELFLGCAFGLLQQGKNIVGVLYFTVCVVHHHTPVWQHREGAGLTAEGGHLQGIHQIGVVEGDRNRLIGKIPVAALSGRHGKHHDFRLVRHHGVDDHRLFIQDQAR